MSILALQRCHAPLKLKHLSLAIIGLLTVFTILTGLHAQGTAARSVWDGVYTDQQAKRGESPYHDYCADCHGDDLEGDAEAPALSGAMFQTNWEGLPLGSLFQRIRRDMPLNKYVGTLSPGMNADILAYILKVNRFPQGSAELSHAAEVLNQIRFESVKPDRKR
jgi:mono/diheme cytochrome c family protein